MRISKVLLLSGILISLTFVDTVFLKRVGYTGIRPDLILLVLIFMAHSIGSLESVISGFAAGLVIDVLTLAPFGFYGIIYSLIGYLYGKTKNKVFLDPLFFPIVFVLFGEIIKAISSGMIIVIFIPDKSFLLFSKTYVLGILLDLISAPFIFGFLKLTRLSKENDRIGF